MEGLCSAVFAQASQAGDDQQKSSGYGAQISASVMEGLKIVKKGDLATGWEK